MSDEESALPSSTQILKLLDTLQTAVEATTKATKPLLKKAKSSDESLDFGSGLSLLLVRPQILLTSLHHLVTLVGLRLAAGSEHTPSIEASTALAAQFADGRQRSTTTSDELQDELAGELALCHEVMDKVRGMETKLEYQIKKLVGLAEASAKKAPVEDIEEGEFILYPLTVDPLSFRPNPTALVAAARAAPKQQRRNDADDDTDAVYRPPRISAVPYNEPSSSSKRSERRAPALLSEFAAGLDGAPGVQMTTGLSTRPIMGHTNSASAKRAAELKRIAEFEEDNMTRLVTTKREAKRRRDDEEALAMGFGVGSGRSRRKNGLEAELEGVLGERGSKGLWEGVNAKLGKRDSLTTRAKRTTEGAGERISGPKKARFEKDVARKRRAIGLPTKRK